MVQMPSGEAKKRRLTAYLLKGLAVFGGIAVAAGLRGWWSQAVGILITVAVAIDALSANHSRLLTLTKASQAYSRLLETTSHGYDQDLAPLFRLRGISPHEAEAQLEAMIRTATETLFAERQKIETALQEDDLKLLNSLSVEGTKAPDFH